MNTECYVSGTDRENSIPYFFYRRIIHYLIIFKKVLCSEP